MMMECRKVHKYDLLVLLSACYTADLCLYHHGCDIAIHLKQFFDLPVRNTTLV